MESILIVEVEEEVRSILEMHLKSQNFDCTSAESTQEALALCESNQFDCILTDIMMPNMTGIEFLQKLNTLEFVPPVVFLTGYEDREILKSCLRLGAFDFISKPYSRKDLVDIVNRAAQIGQRQKQVFFESTDDPNLENRKIRGLRSITKSSRSSAFRQALFDIFFS